MKKQIRFKPSKEAQAFSRVFSGVFALVGISFVVIGVTQVIPSGAGLFGIVWTGMAACFAGIGIYGMVNKKGIYGLSRWGLEIEEEDETSVPAEMREKEVESVEARLKQLEDLREKRLITAGEYEEKRKEILKEL